MKKWAWLVLLIPIGLYLPNLNRFAFPLLSQYSDLLITHWPNANFIHQSVFSQFQIPLWNDSILAGYPFFANPLAGLWYLPGWIANLFPTSAAFNGLFLAHIFAGGLGIYLLLRDEDFLVEYAILGALAFELMPKLWAHFAQGHISLVYAVCLTPWLLLITRRAILSKPGNYYRFLPAFLIAGIILADPRWLPYALILWFAIIVHVFRSERSLLRENKWYWGRFYFIHLGLGTLMSTILILPMIQYTQLSTRSLMTLQDNLSFSLPLSKLLLALFPSPGITAEWVFYLGGLGFIAILLILANPDARSRSFVWLSVFLFGILLAISASIPLFSQVWRIPGLSLIRVPSRALFMCGFSVCFLIPFAVKSVVNKSGSRKTTNLILAACAAFGGLILVASLAAGTPATLVGAIQGAASIFIFAIILFVLHNRNYSASWVWLITGVLLLDFTAYNFRSIQFVENTIAFSSGSSFLKFFSSQTGEPYRIFTPSNSLPQQTASQAGVEMANGIDPIQLITLQEFSLFNIPGSDKSNGYSITFPPFRTGTPESDNREILLDTQKLGLLNVKYVLSAFPVENERLELVGVDKEGYIYENLDFLPRAWVQNAASPPGTEILEIPVFHKNANQISLTSKQGGSLILSEIMYPGWKAWIDGQRVTLKPQAGILRSIEVPEGEHEVIFRFQPDIFWLGITITAITAIGLIIYGLVSFRSTHDKSA
jgi:hypothetical protein